MKISPMTPHAPSSVQTVDTGVKAAAMRVKAIAAFNGSKSSPQPQGEVQRHPSPQVVLNANAVAPEEMGAITTNSSQQDVGQADMNVVSEETQPEAAAVEPQPSTTPDPALSRQFAQLARQEKALRAKVIAQEQAYKARESALLAREAELSSKQIDPSKYIDRERLKSDPLSVLAEAEVSYDDLTQRIINRQPVDPQLQVTINELRNEIKALRASDEQRTKMQSETQQAQYDAAVKQIKLDARHLVNMDPAFETIKATNSVSDVVELITQTYEKDGILLTVEEAAQQVEDYLVEEAMKVTKIGKIQQRLAATSTSKPTIQAQKTQHAQPVQSQTPMKTLTNAQSSSRQMSSRERAIAAFHGKLK